MGGFRLRPVLGKMAAWEIIGAAKDTANDFDNVFSSPYLHRYAEIACFYHLIGLFNPLSLASMFLLT